MIRTGGDLGGYAYGLFLDNTSRTYFDMGKTDPARVTFGVRRIDFGMGLSF